ncbi:DUF421 domain-containing protein [Paenibacillus sp. J2TS4]|uniref:DUF421 domain-containing protein n=1 Tax=Paenibacillus sp. J2TS4 TaxID=2807194 RepID=UPI001B056DFB|nr:DUF421 domain-containing protein [Paenibacillus sp. J2TS4]GIP31398.1 hypothetical protein J2TS4_06080 [Paenibacillus sp. J2TS4]
MDALILAFRTVIMYALVYIVLRLMGKREIGKLSVFDLVISIMIAEIAVFVIEDEDKPFWEGLLPIAILLIIQISIAYIMLHSQKFRVFLDGKPSFLIKNGKLNRKEMKKQRYNLDDLILQLRENKITNVSDVEFAILETTGKLTVVEKQKNQQKQLPQGQSASTQQANQAGQQPAQKKKAANKKNNANKQQNQAQAQSSGQQQPPSTAQEKIRYEGLPLPLIMDGKVQDKNLETIGKTRFWLKNELQTNGVNDFKEVFFCSIDHKGKIYIDKK